MSLDNICKTSFCSTSGQFILWVEAKCEGYNAETKPERNNALEKASDPVDSITSGIIKRIAALAIIVIAVAELTLFEIHCLIFLPLVCLDNQEAVAIKRHAKNITGSFATIFKCLLTIFTGNLPGVNYSLHGEGITPALKTLILEPMIQISREAIYETEFLGEKEQKEQDVDVKEQKEKLSQIQIIKRDKILKRHTELISKSKAVFKKIIKELDSVKDTAQQFEPLFKELVGQVELLRAKKLGSENQMYFIRQILATLNKKHILFSEEMIRSASISEEVRKIMNHYSLSTTHLAAVIARPALIATVLTIPAPTSGRFDVMASAPIAITKSMVAEASCLENERTPIDMEASHKKKTQVAPISGQSLLLGKLLEQRNYVDKLGNPLVGKDGKPIRAPRIPSHLIPNISEFINK